MASGHRCDDTSLTPAGAPNEWETGHCTPPRAHGVHGSRPFAGTAMFRKDGWILTVRLGTSDLTDRGGSGHSLGKEGKDGAGAPFHDRSYCSPSTKSDLSMTFGLPSKVTISQSIPYTLRIMSLSNTSSGVPDLSMIPGGDITITLEE